MPLSTDTQTLETSKGLVDALRGAQGDVSTLSKAPHFTLPSTPITVRFSSSTGIPSIPDTEPTANPRGLAIRFHLPSSDGKRRHTDIIAHSTRYFPTRTGAEFLEMLQALGSGGEAVPAFLGTHPETVRFLQDPKPSPASFATEAYFGVNAFVFTNAEGKETFVRYRVEPVAGLQTLSSDELASKGSNYLFEELEPRLEKGAVVFKLMVQIAGEEDTTDDATVLWPEEREVVELGEVRIEKTKAEEESLKEQKDVIFDPIPRWEAEKGGRRS
ncbi:uncharacterized protein N0V89_001901 [Didymosphaeria variabile]|uniref:Catalase core domain-containing protein n=1 Tax=Didymosphaeria variabile TaxID=1932322 RepID=A0A9W8XRJ1_9PLEO|nr:uncharacterized protein N0V89_001901 [Didymosphaeria variabile]KAJ4357326.1 hypothetical protein N0V89_001901 [Didymosphaeria variabile]